MFRVDETPYNGPQVSWRPFRLNETFIFCQNQTFRFDETPIISRTFGWCRWMFEMFQETYSEISIKNLISWSRWFWKRGLHDGNVLEYVDPRFLEHFAGLLVRVGSQVGGIKPWGFYNKYWLTWKSVFQNKMFTGFSCKFCFVTLLYL